ncbi:Protein BUNDLE SHEATH DEFECTIVE 2, chloroplastic [Linum perenne]
MASSSSFTAICSLNCPNKPASFSRLFICFWVGIIGNSAAGKFFRVSKAFEASKTPKSRSLEVKASNEDSKPTKTRSIVCGDCEGNGALACSQCKGSGVNSEDHFNGRFKVGGLCWLCRGKREMLCGNCNGAGFVGGFMNS